ncbi:MAG: endo-1,4-beta-xylanase [Microbacteriaceae bacterium]|nr:endo-1,4-beta-xylanase [Nocardioidaceae bacterium]MCL2794113.1 endo-1,4-beta-xylanase [Microbacteriaceae bacterium]
MTSPHRRRTPLVKLGLGVAVAAVFAAPLAATVPAVGATAAGTTVLDSTFDDGTITPWTANGGASLSVVADPSRAGESLEATGITAGYMGPAVDLTKLLTPGVAYTVSFDARVAADTASAGLGDSVHFTVDDGNYTWVSSGQSISDSAWTTITGTYTLAAGATKANMYLDSTLPSGQTAYPDVLIDNVTITGPAGGSTGGGTTTCTPVAAQSLVSANFDDQTLDGLTQDGSPTSLSYENVSGDAAGDYSLRVNGRTNNYDGVQTAKGAFSSLAAGDTVTVSAKVRLATQTSDAAQMRIVSNPGYTWIGNQSAVTDGAWSTISGTYTIPAGTDTSALQFYVGTDGLTTADGTADASLTSYDYDVNDLSIGIPGTDCSGSGGTGSTCTYPTSSTLISSDFESGDADGWVPRADAKGQATVSVVSGGYNSSNALEATNRNDQGEAVGHDVTCLLQPSQTYEFSGWVRFAAGQPTDDVWLSLANTVGGTTSYSTLGQFTNVTDSGWAQIDQTFTMPASSDSAMIYLETKYYSDGSAGNTSDMLFDDLTLTKPAPLTVQDITPIKDTLPFPVGAAVSDPEITGAPGQLLAKHFDQVTPENTMKPEAWYNADGSFVTTNADADALMTYAQQNDMRVYGHNLVWYQQTPDWFFDVSPTDSTPLTNSPADQAILRARLDQHIYDVAQYLSSKFGAFGSSTNPLVSFDVVNEAVSDNVGDPDDLRQSRWYQVLGESYIEEAFNDANKDFNQTFAAPGATHPIALFYNDYNTEQAGKRARVLELVNRLIADGVPIDGIGHQFHVTMATPVSSLKDAIDAFNGIQTADGHELYQAVTELDVPTGTPVTTANEIEQGYYYKDVFDMLRSEYAAGSKIFSATVWGLTDGQSWRASSGAPLLFDDNLQAKPAYYGVTDQTLPPLQQTAVVFQEDASDVGGSSSGATGSVEWNQLPLKPIGDNGDAGFQLRWAADHLTAYVSVTDSSDDPTDQASFTWGDGTQTATVNRDGTVTGTGVTAQVSTTAAGWSAVVTLPDSGLSSTSTPKFDVAVTNGSTVEDWNTPGTLGTLQLVEPLSFTTIPEASVAPVIDGTKDPVWNEATTVETDKLISGSATGAKATVYQLWKDDYLYVLADVTDPTIDVSSPNAYEQDSVEIFTDPGNVKNGAYLTSDAQMRINVDNATSFGAGDTEANQEARLESATSRTATGYIVEARIDLGTGVTGVGTFQGVDYEVNDGTNGARTANFGWAEQTGTAYETTARWGVAELTGPSQAAPVITTQPTSASVGKDTTVTFTAAASGNPAPTVQWQYEKTGSRQWITLPGATSPSLTLAGSPSLSGNVYRAVFTNALGTAATDGATLTVSAGKVK